MRIIVIFVLLWMPIGDLAGAESASPAAEPAMHLLELHEYMPDLKLDDGTSSLDLANSVLRYLMSQAVPAKKGFVWPYMRNTREWPSVSIRSSLG